MKRVLHIVDKMNIGGTESLLMNIYRNIDRDKIQFDFLTYYNKNERGFFDEEIKTLGGRIYNIKSPKESKLNIITNIRKIIKINNFKIVHCHTTYSCGFAMIAAKKEKVPLRIIHSHNRGNGEKFEIHRFFYKSLMKKIINHYANRFVACSDAAAKFLFNKKNYKKYIFIPNGINFDKFFSVNNNILDLKKELNIPEGAKIIGHIGRYGKVKNHDFIIDLFKKILQKNSNIYLILVGDGPTKHLIIDKIKKYGITEKVKVLGLRTDIPELLNIMDVFILPSLYEGFGIVLLEAQSMGLPCIVSENVPKETDMGFNLIKWVNLNDVDKWINMILESLDSKIDKEKIKKKIYMSPYNIKNVVKEFYKLYEIES